MGSGRLFIAIVSSLLDEAIIIAVIIFGLPLLGVNIPTFGIIIIGIAFLIYATTLYILGSRILGKKPTAGLTSMLGMEGRVVCRLNPRGVVKIKGELWEAKTEDGTIDPGTDVIVTGQARMKLIVRQK
jgi:membrane protein implicated in regulation of membrane protease activity